MVPENNITRPEIGIAVVLCELLFLLAWFVFQELGVV